MHTDAAHAPLFYDCNVEEVQIMSFDSLKIYGPKGIGFLYKRKRVLLDPLVKGGEQEFGMRGGTENPMLVMAMAKALFLAKERRKTDKKKMEKLSEYFLDLVFKEIEGVSLNGDRKLKAPHIVNISVQGFDNEFLVLNMDKKGVACSTGAACKNLDVGDESPGSVSVLRKGSSYQRSSLRFSFSRKTKKKDVRKTVRILKEIVEKNS